jgi:ribosomal protein S18 acetylase RimI-like enzyme
VHVALITPENHESFVHVLHELHLHYNPASTVSRRTVQRHLLENLLGRNSPIQLVVATNQENSVTGFAAIVMLHSLTEPEPNVKDQCLLKELFVSKAHRSSGVGRALMAWVARNAAERGVSRIDWSVQAANTPAKAFYEKLGAQFIQDRLSYRLSRASIEQLASKGTNATDA